jgi:hypothetical protein
MQILTASEHQAFDAPPVFSYAERDRFFQVSERLNAILAMLRSPTNRIGLVLTIGYFRDIKRFPRDSYHGPLMHAAHSDRVEIFQAERILGGVMPSRFLNPTPT